MVKNQKKDVQSMWIESYFYFITIFYNHEKKNKWPTKWTNMIILPKIKAVKKTKATQTFGLLRLFLFNFVKKKKPAATYFPAVKQYHRRKRAWLPCSVWERVLPLHYGHRHLLTRSVTVQQDLSVRLTACYKLRTDKVLKQKIKIWSSLTTY